MKTRRSVPSPTPPAPSPPDEAETADPARLAGAATLAAGRAMRRGRWQEARSLTALAESYVKLGREPAGGGQTLETLDLKLLHAVLTDLTGTAVGRMAVSDRDTPDEAAIKDDYHRLRAEASQQRTHHQMALIRRIHAAERKVRDLGGEVVVSESGFHALAEEREWLLKTATELEDVTVTPSPPRGDPWKVGM